MVRRGRFGRYRLRTVKELADWMKSTAEEMFEKDSDGCSFFFPDPHDRTWCVAIGWLSGYDPANAGKNEDYHSKKYPEYCLNAEVVRYDSGDCADLEWMQMPYSKKDGEVWNTACTLGKASKRAWLKRAGYFRKEFLAIQKETEKEDSEWK